MAAMTGGQSSLREYMLGEFKRRHALSTLRQELQSNMPDKYVNLWWCKDEALREIRKQFVESTNHCVIDSFLGADATQCVREEVTSADESQLLATNGMLTFQGRNAAVRTDVLGWFDCTAPPSGGTAACSFDSQDDDNSWQWLQYLLQRMETIVTELGGLEGANMSPSRTKEDEVADNMIGQDFKQCTSRSRVMVTKYEGKDDQSSHYEKHLDNGNKNGRRVTAIYYMNSEWRRSHGGALRLFVRNHCRSVRRTSPEEEHEDANDDEEDIEEIYCDVEPMADRLVLFMSDARTPHEVLPTHKDRFAVTVWFWDATEKAASDLRQSQLSESSDTKQS